jgi:transcriptional regulator with XRE-family HTH domain
MDPTTEFKRLARLSEWNNERIARECGISPQYVGQILNGVAVKGKPVKASVPVMKALILALMTNKPEVLSNAGELKEVVPEGDAALWKRRAKEAELKLEKIRGGMRTLLEATSAAVAAPESTINSGAPSEDEELLDALEEGEPGSSESRKHSPEAGEPSVPSSPPPRHVSPETKGKRGLQGKVPK